MGGALTCRFCGTPLRHSMVDLGTSPLANSLVGLEGLGKPEVHYPLKVYVCAHCRLAQLPEHERAEEIFSDYVYFSSYSDSWLSHCRAFAQDATQRFNLGPDQLVLEVASNDGYLLQFFQQEGVQVLGVDPSRTVAKAAETKGIQTVVEFFGIRLAGRLVDRGLKPSLLVANNVLAHVPNLNDFIEGVRIVLAEDGVATFEFPSLVNLVEGRQFDTIYHEHFSYFTFTVAERVFLAHGLCVFDVDELTTHGGSLRLYVRHAEADGPPTSARVEALRQSEHDRGYDTLETLVSFGERVQSVKREFLHFLLDAKEGGKTVVGYGAPAKGVTFLNYCGVRSDLIDFTVDRSPHKQGKFLPGVRIPIVAPDQIEATRPDFVIILPWNLRDEIVRSMQAVRSWGGRFVVAIPKLDVF